MADSLLIGTLEMLGASVNPEFRLAQGGLDLGTYEPDTATIGALLLDGDVITGTRTKNRMITLPIRIYATGASTAAIRSSLTASVETLLSVVNQDSFTVQWTPDGGLPLIFDCYRATAQRSRAIVTEQQGWSLVTLTFAAKPFGRSTVAQAPTLTNTASTTHGKAFSLAALVGSARAPVNLALSTGGTFSWFLLHTPPASQDSAATILVPLNSSLALQTVTLAAANAKHRGTYSIVLGGATDGTAATAQITITQKENGTQVGNPWVSTVQTHDITTQGPLWPFAEVTLPIYDTPSDNTKTSYDINVNISAGTDRYSEVMLCNTAGQTILTETGSSFLAGSTVYVDEPSPLQSGPPVFVSASDRTAAWSNLEVCVVSGGPVLFEPGAVNKLIAWTDSGTPAVAVSYYPRWLDERVS